MNDLLAKLDKDVAVIIAVAWLLREIFGYVQRLVNSLMDGMAKKTNGNGNGTIILESLLRSLEDNLSATRELITEVRVTCSKLQHIEEVMSKCTKT